MSSFFLHTGLQSCKSLLPFVDSIINDTLWQPIPCVSQALLQIGHVSNWPLTDTILHNTLYSIVYVAKIRNIWKQYIWSNEFRSFTLKELDCLWRARLCWGTVLPEYVSVTSNGTNGWQHLLHQYDVVIITAISLSARIDENEAPASWQR